MTMKEKLHMINETAKENFDKAQGMLEMLNYYEGEKFGWLRKRVVRFEDPDASTCIKYAHCHDAECEQE